MRVAHAALGVLMVGAAAILVAAGGRTGSTPAADMPVAAETSATTRAEDTGSASAQKVRPLPSPVHAASRTIDPETVAPPDLAAGDLERIEPRPPLSDLALAGPPRPKPPGEWRGKPLFQPVATAAGLIEAKGHAIAISGIGAVMPDETCTDAAGTSWACGLAARTAFRAFLRGRAVTCAAPAEGGAAAACSVGKRDVGQWLAETGWARALETGPYAQAGETARKAGKGIFGPAPDLSDLPPPPPPVETTTPASPSILDLSGTAATPPVDPPTPAR
jgi:endonuclease YncB( thermonuclease family)